MLVRDSDVAERRGKRLRAELRVSPRAWVRSDVREGSDLGGTKGLEEFLERSRTVTDGPDLHTDQCERLVG